MNYRILTILIFFCIGKESLHAQNSSENNFLNAEASADNIYKGEQVELVYKLYYQNEITSPELKTIPSFEGFLKENAEIPRNLVVSEERYRKGRYNTVIIYSVLLQGEKPGKYLIGPLELECLEKGGNRKKIRLKSQQVHIVVKELPAGANPGYYGLVGHFSVSGQAERIEASANKSFHFIIQISGKGNLRFLKAPELNLPDGVMLHGIAFTDSFRIGNARLQGNRTFTYKLSAKRAGDYTITPAELSYFDPDGEVYKPLHFKQTSIHVSENMNEEGLIRSGTDTFQYPEPIYTGKTHLTLVGHSFLLTFVFWLLLLLPISGIAFILYTYQRGIPSWIEQFYSASSHEKAFLKNIKRIQTQYDPQMLDRCFEDIQKMIYSYFSLKHSVALNTLSRDKIRELMEKTKIPETEILKMENVLEYCDIARFSGTDCQVNINSIFEDIESFIRCMLRIERHGLIKGLRLFMMMTFCLSALHSFSLPYPEKRAFQMANEFYSARQFHTALTMYNSILTSGKHSFELYYNLGNTQYMLGHYAEAVTNYERAVKTGIWNKRVRNNLLLVRSKCDDDVKPAPNYQLAEFFKYNIARLSTKQWSIVTILMLWISFILIVLHSVMKGSTHRRKISFSFIAMLALFFICCFLMYNRYKTEKSRKDLVVYEREIIVRNQPDIQGNEVFRIHEGLKVHLEDKAGQWVLIKIPDGRSGWVETASLIVI